ncbi:MAG: methylaspartate ammonia-lyase [Nocardioides sp.]
MRVERVLAVPGLGTHSNDDQAAIKAGAKRDGYFYTGTPLTTGYRRVRQASQSLQVLLLLEDGHVVSGGGVSVQYAGGSGREPVLNADAAAARWEGPLNDALAGGPIDSFRDTSAALDLLECPRAVAYGVSQALLEGAAYAARTSMAEVIAEEYQSGARPQAVDLLAQCGESRYDAVDRMILRRVDSLPHGLVNHVDLVGADGGRLLEYVAWVRDRVLAFRDDDGYAPILHFDCYGTLGDVFPGLGEVADLLARLADMAAPFTLRIEQPVNAPSRAAQLEALADLRQRLRALSAAVTLVADEWCNTYDDVVAFLEAEAADMLQVKMPDVGAIDASIRAILACRAAGVGAYCGGSCAETEQSARTAVHVAMGAGADVVLARPGMGVDEAVMVTRNEMIRTLALASVRDRA